MLVNKLGDPCYKVAANTAHLLTRLGKLAAFLSVFINCNKLMYGTCNVQCTQKECVSVNFRVRVCHMD